MWAAILHWRCATHSAARAVLPCGVRTNARRHRLLVRLQKTPERNKEQLIEPNHKRETIFMYSYQQILPIWTRSCSAFSLRVVSGAQCQERLSDYLIIQSQKLGHGQTAKGAVRPDRGFFLRAALHHLPQPGDSRYDGQEQCAPAPGAVACHAKQAR
jgi:hypothetical protein